MISNVATNDFRRANCTANPACGQISCVPNGALDFIDDDYGSSDDESLDNDELVPDRVIGGSVWLAKSAENKVYAVSASHVLDNDDAYLQNYNIIGSHVVKGTSGNSSCDYVYKSVENQCKLYFFTTSKSVRISQLKLYKSNGCRVWSLRSDESPFDTFESLSEISVNSPENNILHTAFGIPANSICENENRFGWEQNCEGELRPDTGTDGVGGMSSDTADLNFCIGSLDLDQFDGQNIAYIKYKFYGLHGWGCEEPQENECLYVMTRGHKLPRWTQNMFTDGLETTEFMNKGSIMAVFPKISEFESRPIPLQVVGGDHRADIVIMRPNFAAWNELYDPTFTEDDWDGQDGLTFASMSDLYTGDGVCVIGNPEWVLKNSLSGGSIRNKEMVESSYVPSGALMTSIVPIHGMSGGPIITKNGTVAGLFTFGVGSEGTNMCGGPNARILAKVFNTVTETFEASGEVFDEIQYSKYYLGADFYDFSTDYFYESIYALSADKPVTGLYINAIDESGPLYSAGLDVGYIITSITYKKQCSPCTEVVVNLGNGKSSIFDILYNSDIYNNKIEVTYYKDNSNLCEDTSCVTMCFTTYKNNTDYYFGDTAYSKATSSKKVVGTSNGLTYSNNVERSSDSFVQKTIITKNASVVPKAVAVAEAAVGAPAPTKKMRLISKKNRATFKTSVVGRALRAMVKDAEDPGSDKGDTKDNILPTKTPAKKRTVA
jgi:hypothetical protein